MKPYYQDDAVTLYHGDARAIAPPADVLVTDPPYGVNLGGPDVGRNGRSGRHGLEKNRYASYDDTYENFLLVVVPVVRSALERVSRGAVFCGPHLQDLPKASALGGVYCRAGSGRHPWGFKTFLPVLFYGTDPQLQRGARPNVFESTATAEANGHPCPKPLSWMRWLVEFASLPGETVLDPFAGSGTTLRAAKDLGRKAIGVEVEERYCEIVAQLCAQEVLELVGDRSGLTEPTQEPEDRPRVQPNGVCEDCGEFACPECGREECGECDGFLFPDKPWKHSFACAIHDDEPCTCKEAA